MPKWTLHTEFTFDAAHYIEGYDGNCGRMHGHRYKVRISAESDTLHPSEYLDAPDMVCDFRELKWASRDQEKGGLDHSVLNEQLPVNPTAERIAEFIFRETQKRVPEKVSLKITVWESENCWVEYSE